MFGKFSFPIKKFHFGTHSSSLHTESIEHSTYKLIGNKKKQVRDWQGQYPNLGLKQAYMFRESGLPSPTSFKQLGKRTTVPIGPYCARSARKFWVFPRALGESVC